MPTLPADYQAKIADTAICENIRIGLSVLELAVTQAYCAGRKHDAKELAKHIEQIRAIYLVLYARGME